MDLNQEIRDADQYINFLTASYFPHVSNLPPLSPATRNFLEEITAFTSLECGESSQAMDIGMFNAKHDNNNNNNNNNAI